jgi:hypothetical protein
MVLDSGQKLRPKILKRAQVDFANPEIHVM